jgi:hypothetical protein
MLAITLRVPKPRDTGSTTGGPSRSSQRILKTSASTFQLIARRPARVDSAPYLAEFVTSSCSAIASVCAVAGCSWTFDPPKAIWSFI